MLDKKYPLPVVDITISPDDVIRAVGHAEETKNKGAVVGFYSIARYGTMACQLLDCEFPVHVIEMHSEVRPLLRKLKSQGYSTVICDTITSHIAVELDMHPILIASSTESIERSMDQAITLGWKILKLRSEIKEPLPSGKTEPGNVSVLSDLNRPLQMIEQDIVKSVIQQNGGSQKKAAEVLNISRSTIWRMLKESTMIQTK